jgi:hypothetical protein
MVQRSPMLFSLGSDGGQTTDDADKFVDPEAPLQAMLSQVEAARLVADGHLLQDDQWPCGPPEEATTPFEQPFDYGYGDGDGPPGVSPRNATDAQSFLKQRGNLAHTFSDPVDMGFCSSKTGEELVQLWVIVARRLGLIKQVLCQMSSIHACVRLCRGHLGKVDYIVSVQRADVSLRFRSPLSITTLIMVGKKIEDGAGTSRFSEYRADRRPI